MSLSLRHSEGKIPRVPSLNLDNIRAENEKEPSYQAGGRSVDSLLSCLYPAGHEFELPVEGYEKLSGSGVAGTKKEKPILSRSGLFITSPEGKVLGHAPLVLPPSSQTPSLAQDWKEPKAEKELKWTGSDTSRLTFLPIKYPTLEKFYQDQKNIFWSPQEISLGSDSKHYQKASPELARAVRYILCFFAQVDGVVVESLALNFKKDTSHIKECKFFYAVQEFMEVIHSEMYSLLVEAILPHGDREMAFDAIARMDCIGAISRWYETWMTDRPLLVRILTNAFLEGPLLSGLFAFIALLKARGKFKGLSMANDLISRDEAIHYQFALTLFDVLASSSPLSAPVEGLLCSHYPSLGIDPPLVRVSKESVQSDITAMVTSGMAVVDNFLDEMITGTVLGVTSKDVGAHVRCIADHMLKSVGYQPIYNVPDPMESQSILVSMTPKYNFHETRDVNYCKGLETSELNFGGEVDF